MKVFISWSGDYSREIAEAYRKWLPQVLQAARPYFTPSDVDKGARWQSEIAVELEASSYGVFFLTPENLVAPWLMFEAGAISKNVGSSRVTPILFDVDVANVRGPLASFQCMKFAQADLRALTSQMNSLCGDAKLDDSTLQEVYNTYWPKLENTISTIRKRYEGVKEQNPTRSDRDLLEEVLSITRTISRTPSTDRSVALATRPVKDAVAAFHQLAFGIKSESDYGNLMQILSAATPAIDYLCRHIQNSQARRDCMSMLDDIIVLTGFRPVDDSPF